MTQPLRPADLLVEGRQLIDALVGRLEQQAGGACATPVQVVETHISWVLLAGDLAFKIKKPVNLGFLDFSTLHSRKYYCEEELRLNRRFAPQLYLAVVPITGSPRQPELGGSGPVFEYAVKMRRFDQTAIFDSLISNDRLQPAMLDSLAVGMAALHREAKAASSQDAFGTPDSVIGRAMESIEAVLQSTQSLTDIPAAARLKSTIESLSNWLDDRMADIQALASARKQSGFVRECHGDLHLGNIALINEQVTLFDCLEFDADLRWIDVMSDVAFVVMDLLFHQRPDLAYRFLNAYLEQSGDYEGLQMLRFYVAYRGLVRAKVAMQRARQLPVGSQEQLLQIEAAHAYALLALEQTRNGAASLMICFGLSGSGKTVISEAILEGLPAIRLRSDVERKRLAGLKPLTRTNSRFGTGLYAADGTAQTYRRLAELTEVIFRAGFSVIVDASFLRSHDRLTFADLAKQLSAAFFVLDVRVDEPTLRCRVQRRLKTGADASEANLEVLERQLTLREPLSDDECKHALMIDNAQNRSELEVRQVCRPMIERIMNECRNPKRRPGSC